MTDITSTITKSTAEDTDYHIRITAEDDEFEADVNAETLAALADQFSQVAPDEHQLGEELEDITA